MNITGYFKNYFTANEMPETIYFISHTPKILMMIYWSDLLFKAWTRAIKLMFQRGYFIANRCMLTAKSHSNMKLESYFNTPLVIIHLLEFKAEKSEALNFWHMLSSDLYFLLVMLSDYCYQTFSCINKSYSASLKSASSLSLLFCCSCFNKKCCFFFLKWEAIFFPTSFLTTESWHFNFFT